LRRSCCVVLVRLGALLALQLRLPQSGPDLVALPLSQVVGPQQMLSGRKPGKRTVFVSLSVQMTLTALAI